MLFPFTISSDIKLEQGEISRLVTLHEGVTVILGPNGSGKTHLMRGLKDKLSEHCSGKVVRFLSAGRVGMFEQFRSNSDGYRRSTPNYEDANYGSLRDTKRRHEYETLQGDFQTLAVRPDILIKIRERLRKLFARDLNVLWDGGSLKIEFERISENSVAYSSAREASGLLHLAGLLAALYDDEVGAVLIDEPEVSLHPQLQSFLLKEILDVVGKPELGTNKKIVILATHSTEFLRIDSPKDISRLIFCYDLNQAPIQVPIDADELQGEKLAGLIARMGQEHKLAFFAKSPLLVEGPSDSIICGSLANKLGIHIEAGGSQLLPVIGKGQFPIVVKLLKLAGKTPLVLADADGIADGVELANSFLTNAEADRLAAKVGGGRATEFCRSIYSAFSDLVKDHWDDIVRYAEKHPYWTSRESSKVELTTAKRRAAFVTLYILTEDELSNLGIGERWKNIKLRFDALLALLETQGCFFLRRGTVESYYEEGEGALSLTSDKPASAAAEAAQFVDIQNSLLEERYADIVRCLRVASKTEPIIEAESLQDALLAIAAPALARVKGGAPSSSLNALARSMVGDRSKLFDLSICADKLRIDLKSSILDVSGFPIEIASDDDVVQVVSRALGLS